MGSRVATAEESFIQLKAQKEERIIVCVKLRMKKMKKHSQYNGNENNINGFYQKEHSRLDYENSPNMLFVTKELQKIE